VRKSYSNDNIIIPHIVKLKLSTSKLLSCSKLYSCLHFWMAKNLPRIYNQLFEQNINKFFVLTECVWINTDKTNSIDKMSNNEKIILKRYEY